LLRIEVLISCEIEGFFDVLPCFGAHLEVGKGGFLYFGSYAIVRDFPLFPEIGFVAE
jgi:hypothetical protein